VGFSEVVVIAVVVCAEVVEVCTVVAVDVLLVDETIDEVADGFAAEDVVVRCIELELVV